MARVGIVTKWFNRGQAFVSRYVRDALEARGHETFILARPTKDKGPMAAHVDRTGVWDQPGVTEASDWEVPYEEYVRWIEANSIEVVHWDNCYQHDEIARLRESGVKTVGRFVWEMFSESDAAPAKAAYDVLYSMTRCEQERYARLGIESPYVQWGIHKELLEVPVERADDGLVRFYFPGALLGPRKPHREVVEAFRSGEGGQPPPDLQGAARAPHELPDQGRRGGPADRARRRRHGDLRAPEAVRLLRRLPRPEPLGGPRPVPVRGGRLRDAADHQRQPADERGRSRRRQRDPHRPTSRTAPPTRGSPR